MPKLITKESHPNIAAAFVAVECDNGAHLIGTAYPGERVNLETWEIPAPYDAQVDEVDAQIARIRAAGADIFETWTSGEHYEAIAVTIQFEAYRAQRFLNAWFDVWTSEPYEGIDDLVERFSAALRTKLHAAQDKHGFTDEWMRTHWREKLLADLAHHVEKGDPLDVAAYAAFAWHHGWSLSGSKGTYEQGVHAALERVRRRAANIAAPYTTAREDVFAREIEAELLGLLGTSATER